MDTLSVLIVGAGPTGLLMACELARHGISFQIIDKNSKPIESSNATWVQPRTLEMLTQLGLIQEFLKSGHPCDGFNLYVDGNSISNIPLTEIDSVFPYILMLPQHNTETILRQRLHEFNHEVEYSAELIDISQQDNKVTAVVKFSDETKVINCDYLIACDGGNSTVRQKCGVYFPGEEIGEQYIVADAKIDSHLAKNQVHIFFDKGTFFIVSPLGSNDYRIAANLPIRHAQQMLYKAQVRDIVQERGHGAYYVKEISWLSPFWIHSKVIENMRYQSVFFAGDSAHLHSPAAGQGMNTGMMDAYNLAWKLALVIKKQASQFLLDSYHAERYPIVKEIVEEGKRLTKLVIAKTDFLEKLESFSAQIASGDKKTIKEIDALFSQISFQYRSSPIIDYQHAEASLKPGERAPDVILDKKKHLYEFFQNTQHNFLFFANQAVLPQIKETQKILQQHYGQLINFHLISKEKLEDEANIIWDSDNHIHEAYKVKNPCLYIIRPDTYIGFYDRDLNAQTIMNFLNSYLRSG